MAEPIKDASSSQTRKHLPLLAALSVLAALAISIFAFSGGEGAHAEGQAAAQAGTENADAKPTKVTSFNDQQTGDIETIVRQYLLKNPELFLEVQRELEKRLQAQETARRQTAISSNAATLFRRKDAPIAGNPDGDVTVVEFFDYNCGFCKRGLKDVEALIKADPKVKVVLKEFPIFGRASEDAARVALAAKVQGKYWEAHRALLNVEGRVDKDTALAAVKSLGLDLKKLETDMKSDAITAEIMQVRDVAQQMGINGTPHFLVGERTIAGAPEDLLEQFKTNIAELRQSGGCKVC